VSFTLRVPADDVRPDEIVRAKRREHKAQLLARHHAALADRRFALRDALRADEQPISPVSEKSSIAVSSVMLARRILVTRFITASADASSVPPTQKPSVLTLSTRRSRARRRSPS
jgi:hypothetical protein